MLRNLSARGGGGISPESSFFLFFDQKQVFLGSKTSSGPVFSPIYRPIRSMLTLFIGPESDHWQCLSLSHSLTNYCLVILD